MIKALQALLRPADTLKNTVGTLAQTSFWQILSTQASTRFVNVRV